VSTAEADQNNARWKLVTIQEFVERALPEWWELSKLIREERDRLAACDKSIRH